MKPLHSLGPFALLTTALLAAAPLAAQTAPTVPQILSALVATAPTALVVSHDGTPLPDISGTALVTLILYDLGIHAPHSDEVYTLGASCDPTPDSADWACGVQMNIDWHGGESGHVLRFALTPTTGTSCTTLTLETVGPYDACAWAIGDNRIVYLLAG